MKAMSLPLALCAVVLSLPSCGSLEGAASSAAWEYLDEQMLHCGDSWYSEIFWTLYAFTELRELDIVLDSDRITEADKANGIDWKGSFAPRATIYRWYGWLSTPQETPTLWSCAERTFGASGWIMADFGLARLVPSG